MGKVVEDLKKRIWHMVEAFTSCNCYKDGEEEPKMIQSSEAEKITIQQRERGMMRLKTPKGPTRPSVPKGPPAQTS
ncbi:hypothetical protein GQ457_06G043380 [Hibiscus cannabinus]